MGKRSRQRQAQKKRRYEQGRKVKGSTLGSCYLCFKPFREGEQVSRLTVPDSITVDLCSKCAGEMQREHKGITHLGQMTSD
jgi:hypothetical protein